MVLFIRMFLWNFFRFGFTELKVIFIKKFAFLHSLFTGKEGLPGPQGPPGDRGDRGK